MTSTVPLTLKSVLYSEADFIFEAIAKSCNPADRLDSSYTFDVLVRNVGRDDFGCWLQKRGEERVAFGAADLLIDMAGCKSAWLWLVYAKPGADLKEIFEGYLWPWATARGATKIQAGNTDYTPHKVRWFGKFGFRKAFDVYERKLCHKV